LNEKTGAVAATALGSDGSSFIAFGSSLVTFGAGNPNEKGIVPLTLLEVLPVGMIGVNPPIAGGFSVLVVAEDAGDTGLNTGASVEGVLIMGADLNAFLKDDSVGVVDIISDEASDSGTSLIGLIFMA
jgi:hypothetical protein